MTINRWRRLTAGAAVLLLATACGSSGDSADSSDEPGGNTAEGCIETFEEGVDYFPDKVEATHSEHWSADYHDSYVVLSVPNSEFEDQGDLNYVLVRCGAPMPELDGELADAPIFEVPVERTVINHRDGIGLLERIDALDTLVGFPTSVLDAAQEDEWVADVVDRAADRTDVGNGDGVEFEITLDLEPDVIYLTGYGSGYSNVSDTVDRGLPAIMVSNRLEPTPLAGSEWVKFVSVFHGRERIANEKFEQMEKRYEDVAAEVRSSLDADVEMGYLCLDPDRGCEFMYAHGPNSFNGHLIETLGASNAFGENNPGGNGMNFDYEKALDAAAGADFLVVYEPLETLDRLFAEDARFLEFRALREKHYLGFINERQKRCVYTSYVSADDLIVDYALGIAPELFPDENPTCFGPPA